MRKIWIDTDMDGDDVMSIILLHNSNQVSIEGITINSSGAISSNKIGIQRCLDLRAALKADFMIFEGANTFFGKSTPKYPIEIRKASQQGYIEKPNKIKNKTWFEFEELSKTLKKYQDYSLELLMIGTATNTAFLLKQDPEISFKFKEIYFSGGNLINEESVKIGLKGCLGDVKSSFGNYDYCAPYCSPYDNIVAEWNVFGDIEAFDFLINKYYKNIWMVPLNTTNNLPFNKEFLKELSNLTSNSGKLFYKVISNITEEHTLLRLWDQGTTMFMLNKANYQYKEVALTVNKQNSIDNDSSGKLIVKNLDKKNINFIYKANAIKIKEEILSLLKK